MSDHDEALRTALAVMMDVNVQDRIAQALDGRRSQRGFVEELWGAWAELTDGFEKLVGAVETADRSLRELPQPTPDQIAVRDAVGTFLRGQNTRHSSPQDLRNHIDEARGRLDAVRHRVNRDTVNIGVVGTTKAGKSTLLRSITGLSDSVVPSSAYNPTTAAPSRIYHVEGTFSATVQLHNWSSFRESYLVPLHRAARLADAPPATPEDFRTYNYPQHTSEYGAGVEADPYLKKLQEARGSFNSYEHLLRGPTELILAESELRPFVAYPLDDDAGSNRPYHAVKNVQIHKNFGNHAVRDLGLIDLPGSGEIGLDVDRQFMQELRNKVDLLLMIKRPTDKDSFLTKADQDTLVSADLARGSVALGDFIFIVINPDLVHGKPGFFANALEKIRDTAAQRGITVLVSDVNQPQDIPKTLMLPVLKHLAMRLAEMDRAAVNAAFEMADRVRADIVTFSDELVERCRGWQRNLPKQRDLFLDLAKRMQYKIAEDLYSLMNQYDAFVKAGETDEELDQGITAATAKARDWVSEGFGKGSREQWLDELRGGIAAEELEVKQNQYNGARSTIAEIYDQIDLSLDKSVQRLWNEIAGVLRGRLTETLVPDIPSALEALRETALNRDADTLAAAIDELLKLKVNYGSIVLRVTRPILRRIHWNEHVAPLPVGGPFTGQMMKAVGPVAVDSLGYASGTPAPISGLAPDRDGKTENWWNQRSAPTRASSSPAGSEEKTVPPPRRGAESLAEDLYDELTEVVNARITELDAALRFEAQLMPNALAAAVDIFFDKSAKTDNIEREYEDLCRPNQQKIWPDDFGSGLAQLAAELAAIDEQVRVVRDAVAWLAGLGSARRLQSPAGARRSANEDRGA